MVDQINSLQQNYNVNLTTLSDINKRIKFQAKNYFERYKELKHQFKKEREDFNLKNQVLENEVKSNIDENIKLQNAYSDLINKDDEVIAIADILNSLKSENDIYVGLSENETEILVIYRF